MQESDIKKIINNFSDEQVWKFYANVVLELSKRKLIRTKNIVGERGEFLVIKTYNSTPGLPNLQAAPEGTQNVDALSRKGERYSIKTITYPGKTTGVFYGCGNIGENEQPAKKFEYVVIVLINNLFEPEKIIEVNWEQFLKYRKWHKTMRAWNLSITRELLKEVNIVLGGHHL